MVTTYRGEGPISDSFRRDVREQQEKLEAEAAEFWRTEKESARLWVPGGQILLPKPRIRLKRKTD